MEANQQQTCKNIVQIEERRKRKYSVTLETNLGDLISRTNFERRASIHELSMAKNPYTRVIKDKNDSRNAEKVIA